VKKLLVSIWRCGGKLYRSYTDGTVEEENLSGQNRKNSMAEGKASATA
jgi:hypothetical protein